MSNKACPDAELLENLYRRYNDPRWLSPDPLEVVLEYKRPRDRELAAVACAALALGSAPLIVRAAQAVLAAAWGSEPDTGARAGAKASLGDRILATGPEKLDRALAGFRYRFFTGRDVAGLLFAAAGLAQARGGLEALFLSGASPEDEDYAPAASAFVRALRAASPWAWKTSLFPDPLDGSAAKRTFLYLRWMVRRDAVDPGPWKRADPAKLVVPLDTHMATACRRLGFLTRASTDLAAAREATRSLRAYSLSDPTRYDFCMTRPGIHPELNPDDCFA